MLAEQITPMTIASVQVWANIWLGVLIVGGTLFLGILAYSVITGAKDIKDMFVSLTASAQKRQQEARGAPTAPQPSTQEPEAKAKARK